MNDMLTDLQKQRQDIMRIRGAVGFCKRKLGMNYVRQVDLSDKEKIIMEQCLVRNFLIPKGLNYFGDRQIIYLDMMDNDDVYRMTERNLETRPLFNTSIEDKW